MISENMMKRIKIRLIKLNMKQKDLALELGISRQQLNNVLNGRVEHLRIEETLENWLEISPTIVLNDKEV